MDISILIFLSSLGIIWAEDPISVVRSRSFKVEPFSLNSETMEDTKDIFISPKSVFVPESKTDFSENDFSRSTNSGGERSFQEEAFSLHSELKDDIVDLFKRPKSFQEEPFSLHSELKDDIMDLFKRPKSFQEEHFSLNYGDMRDILDLSKRPKSVFVPKCKTDFGERDFFRDSAQKRQFQEEPISLNSENKQDILDLFKRSGPDAVPISPVDVSLNKFRLKSDPDRNKLRLKSDPDRDKLNVYRGYRLPSEVESIPVNGEFSLFRDDHKQALSSLIRHFECSGAKQSNTMIQYFKDIKQFVNVYLFQAAASKVLQNMGIKDILPPIYERYPEDFVAKQLLGPLKEESMNITVGRKRRQVEQTRTVSFVTLPDGTTFAYQKLDLSGTDRLPENRLAYFREDFGMNSHHYYWHNLMNDNYVPRQDEYFIYMHSQMLRRYNIERLAVGLESVEEYSDLLTPIEVGHKSNLGYTDQSFGVREDNMIPGDYADLFDQSQERRDLDNQIRRQDRNEEKFLRKLEHYHNIGHVNIASTVRNGPPPSNVMAFTSTSARDNVFYRWHQHIDNMYEAFAEMKRRVTGKSLTYEEMAFKDIVLSDVEVQSYRRNRSNMLWTGCGYHQLNITDGLRFITNGVILDMIHLDHVPFTYYIKYNNQARFVRSGVVRIFLAPQNDKAGNKLNIEEQRKYWIEMDKFKYNFRPGRNLLQRNSSESSVTVDCRRKVPVKPVKKCEDSWHRCEDWKNHCIVNMRYYDFMVENCQQTCRVCIGVKKCEDNRNGCAALKNHCIVNMRYYDYMMENCQQTCRVCNIDDGVEENGNTNCRCGWPQHLLVPRGTPDGMIFNLFVIVTKEENIRDWRMTDSTFCGVPREELSDNREMGFPFHAPAPDNIRDIRDFSIELSNSAVTRISISFTGDPTNPNEDPVDGCGRD